MKKLWGIRHVRYWWAAWRFHAWWADIGRHLGAIPNPSDLEHLEAIWRGDR